MNVKKIISIFSGNIYIPKKLINNSDPLLLHISDTPVFTYRAIKKLVRVLDPDFIVHTGDISDDLKVELTPHLESDALRKASSLIDFFSKLDCIIYIALGNHDSKNLITKYKHIPTIQITDSNGYFEVNNKKFTYSHYSNLLKNAPGDMNLYGHDMNIPSQNINNNNFLNGLENIHIINLRTFDITKLNYPDGTDNSRLRKFKVGI